MFEFDVYEDAAGNTRASLPSHVAHYTVMFFGDFSVFSAVQEHQTMPTLRSDLTLLDASNKVHNCTLSPE